MAGHVEISKVGSNDSQTGRKKAKQKRQPKLPTRQAPATSLHQKGVIWE